MGILADDRVPSFEAWIERKLRGLAPGSAAEVEARLRMLHDGGSRTPAHNEAKVWNYLNAHPSLPTGYATSCSRGSRPRAFDDALIQPYSGHASRQSLEIYSRIALADAQESYDQVIARFPV